MFLCIAYVASFVSLGGRIWTTLELISKESLWSRRNTKTIFKTIWQVGVFLFGNYFRTVIMRNHSILQDWHCVAVISMLKSGDRMHQKNYRLVFLTSACCKIMEHVVTKHIIHFLETNRLLWAHQHGFKRRLSTNTQLIKTVQYFSRASDEHQQTYAISINFHVLSCL